MPESCLSVPKAGVAIFNPEQLDILTPRQFGDDSLKDLGVGPSLGESTQVAQGDRGEASCVGKLCVQVCGEPVNHLNAPTILRLPVEDVSTDAPVEADQLAVDCKCGA